MASHFDHIVYSERDFTVGGLVRKGGVGGFIWGTATSILSARNKATLNISNATGLLTSCAANLIVLVPCTSSLYVQVKNAGGQGDFAWGTASDGRADLIGGRSFKATSAAHVADPVVQAEAEPELVVNYEDQILYGSFWRELADKPNKRIVQVVGAPLKDAQSSWLLLDGRNFKIDCDVLVSKWEQIAAPTAN